MNTTTLTYRIDIHASQQAVFDYVSDWEKQSNWIMLTDVKVIADHPNGEGTTLLATTKVGPVKLTDTMVITKWQSPEEIVVEHTGRIVLGKGVFTVTEITNSSCEFVWQEITPVPFGLLGRVGIVFAKPIMRILFNRSLKRLRAQIESSEASQEAIS